MKTVTLTDHAYERLAAWKESTHDSFSKVVERVVPAKGTLADILEASHQLPPLSAEQARALDKECLAHRQWSDQKDPWTT
jgi:predicted CopG family antitoxin